MELRTEHALQSGRTISSAGNLPCNPWYGVTCNELLVSINRVTGVVAVFAFPLPVAPLDNCSSIGSGPVGSDPELQHSVRYHFDCVFLVKCVDETLLMKPQ